jgi:hypothetical protein
MIDLYHRAFYHIYKSLRRNDKEADAVLTSFLIFSAVQCFNLMTMTLIMSFIGFDFLSGLLKIESKEIYLFVFYIAVAGLNYLYFTSEDRYKGIVKEYSKKPIEERKKGARVTLIYVLVSIALIFILAPLRVKLM